MPAVARVAEAERAPDYVIEKRRPLIYASLTATCVFFLLINEVCSLASTLLRVEAQDCGLETAGRVERDRSHRRHLLPCNPRTSAASHAGVWVSPCTLLDFCFIMLIL